MRVFLCAFDGFYAAVPVDAVLSLTLHTSGAQQTVEYDEKTGNTLFSLPHLFDASKEDTQNIRHGIVLKNRENDDEDRGADALCNKNILLTTAVEREADIPGAEIYPLPEILKKLQGSALFNGIRFVRRQTSGGDRLDAPVLFINTGEAVKFMTSRYTAGEGAGHD
jgi:hypothetical protein